MALALAAGLAGGARAQEPVYKVGAGDVLAVEIRAGGEKQDEFEVTVSPDGAIACPLIGDVAVVGLAAPAIAERISQALALGYFVDPHVQVVVRGSAGRIRVLGEVQHPGVYPLTDARTLMTACDLAGGLTDFAVARRVRLARVEDGRLRFYTLDLGRVRLGRAPDVPLRNGDRIEIPRRWF